MVAHFTRPVARIREGGSAICGTGFLVGGRHVLTCAHVVDDALGRSRGTEQRPEGEITFDLQFLGKEALRARIVAWYPMRSMSELVRDPVADIAVLEITTAIDLSGGIVVAQVDRRVPPAGTRFLTYGFPEGFDNGTQASGEVLIEDAGGWLQVRDTQDRGYFIEPGFSGAPIFSPGGARLIGMATQAD